MTRNSSSKRKGKTQELIKQNRIFIVMFSLNINSKKHLKKLGKTQWFSFRKKRLKSHLFPQLSLNKVKIKGELNRTKRDLPFQKIK
jgi:hypothetical protein